MKTISLRLTEVEYLNLIKLKEEYQKYSIKKITTTDVIKAAMYYNIMNDSQRLLFK